MQNTKENPKTLVIGALFLGWAIVVTLGIYSLADHQQKIDDRLAIMDNKITTVQADLRRQ